MPVRESRNRFVIANTAVDQNPVMRRDQKKPLNRKDEATGFSADTWIELSEITPVPGYSNERIGLFLATDMQAAQQNLDQDEILNVHRISFDEAFTMIRSGKIRHSKTISGLFLADNYLK